MKNIIHLALVLLALWPLYDAAAAHPKAPQADIGPIPQGRLPDLAKPVEYRIALTVLPEQPRFSGHVEIDVELATAARALWINGRGLKVSHAEARTASGHVAATYEQVDPLGVARLDFSRELPAGKATLAFDYDAPFSSSASALFHLNAGNDWYAWSQFESTDARGAFPGFDQPGYKTPFKVTLTTHAGQIATSNALETGVQRDGALERHQFEPTRPLPTYLVQFGVGPFAVASGEVPPTPQRPNPLPLRIVATKPNADKLEYALRESPRIVELLEQYFGQPFPFSKLDQIASPIMQGAMENAGADTYGDTLLLLDAGASTLLDNISMTLDLDTSGPIMPNADGVGYYRFALDDADWRTLIAASPTLAAGEALATTDSLWGAFRAGELPPARLIEAARAMVAHPHSNASVDGGERLVGLRLRGMIPDSALAGYRRTMASIYGPKLAALGSDLRAGAYAVEPSDRQRQRASLVSLVAEEARDPDLRTKLLDATQRYLAGDPGSLDQSELSVGLSVYVDSEGLEGSKGLLMKLVSSQDQLFRSDALAALGDSGQPEQARWLLGVLDGPTLRQTERLELLSELILQPATRDIAYQYLTVNFERLSKDAGIFSFGRLMGMPKYYCSVERARELEKTLGVRERQYRRGSLELARTVESVRSCGLLMQSRGAELVEALHGT